MTNSTPWSSVIQKRVIRSSVIGMHAARRELLEEERDDAAAAADDVAVADHGEARAACRPAYAFAADEQLVADTAWSRRRG